MNADIKLVSHSEYAAIRNRLWPPAPKRIVRIIDQRRTPPPPPAPKPAPKADEPPPPPPPPPTPQDELDRALIFKWQIPAMPPTPRLICAKACERSGISWELLASATRKATVVTERQRLMYALYFGWRKSSLPAIGRLLGGRDHTTVLHAVRRHSERIGRPWPRRP